MICFFPYFFFLRHRIKQPLSVVGHFFFLTRKPKSNKAVWIDIMPVICSVVWDQTERRLWPGCDIMQGVEPSGGLSPNEM